MKYGGMVFIKITDKEIYGVNKLKFKRKNFLLLEPNPVTFYFSLASDSVDQLDYAKNLLNTALEQELNAKDVMFSNVGCICWCNFFNFCIGSIYQPDVTGLCTN